MTARGPEQPVLTLVTTPNAEETLLRAAQRLAAAAGRNVVVLRSYLFSKRPSDLVRRITHINRLSMLVTDWATNAEELQAILQLSVKRNMPAVLIRENPNQRLERVLIPTGGGIHTLRQLWIAQEFAEELGLGVQALYVANRQGDGHLPGAASPHVQSEGELRHAQLQASIVGLPVPVMLHRADDVVTGIAQCASPGDLVVVGAPNYWRVSGHFDGSIPETLSRQLDQSLAMLVAKRSPRVRLREVLWERTICLNLRPRNRDEAIETLIASLVRHGQVPGDRQGHLLDLALSRESLKSTAVDCETAFPHITLPEFPGVIGCLGICPDGVDFGGNDGEPTRFIYLLITPREFYDEYLGILAQIARLMVLPGVRSSLLACRSSRDVLKILDLEEDQGLGVIPHAEPDR